MADVSPSLLLAEAEKELGLKPEAVLAAVRDGRIHLSRQDVLKQATSSPVSESDVVPIDTAAGALGVSSSDVEGLVRDSKVRVSRAHAAKLQA